MSLLRRQLLGVLVGVFWLVVACGSQGSPVSSVPASQSSPTADDLGVTCGNVNLGTPAATVLPDTALDGESTVALDEAVGAVGGEAELISLYHWSVSTKSNSRLVLFGRAIDSRLEEEAPYADAVLTNDGSGWRLSNWGQCRIIVDAPGYGPARVVLDPDSRPDPASSEIDVLINERACANGEAPTGRDIVPVVVADEQRIVINVLVAPVEGDATCPGNPWHPIRILLEEPLGERQVLDGTAVPPQPLDWPPSQQDLNL